MDDTREAIKQWLMATLDQYMPGQTHLEFTLVVIAWIAVVAIFLHLLLQVLVFRLMTKLVNRAGRQWLQLLLSQKLFQRLSFVFQGAVVQVQAGLWLEPTSLALALLKLITDQWILLFGLLAFFSFLDILERLAHSKSSQVRFPLRGIMQTVKLISCVLVGILSISLLMGKSPLIFFSGLGALSAVLMLIFKDPILGLVAGIQLSANKMLAVGDWLEMPKYDSDGDVIDIGLTTVKVRNWDKTITTIPTYALISDSFKNWRGMSESGGRRIKRSILINTASIHFLDEQSLQRLKKAELLGDYLEQKVKAVESANSAKNVDMSLLINGRRLTNIGTFRNYLSSYLKAHPNIHQDMTLMVRQLAPSEQGLPIEIYAFTKTTVWAAYEEIQADIFDHVFAVLPEFGLLAHEAPTGHDLHSLRSATLKPPEH